jgi:hypothetical protein
MSDRPEGEAADRVRHVDHIADSWGCAPRTVRGFIQRGELRGIKAGKRFLVLESECARFLREGPAVPAQATS